MDIGEMIEIGFEYGIEFFVGFATFMVLAVVILGLLGIMIKSFGGDDK